MKSVGVFDILGPIMVGPSSSHTAPGPLSKSHPGLF